MKIETKKDLWALASVLIFAGFVVVGMIASTFSDGYFLLAVFAILVFFPISFMLCLEKYDKLLDEEWEEKTSCQDQN